jgi:hypothetical protein
MTLYEPAHAPEAAALPPAALPAAPAAQANQLEDSTDADTPEGRSGQLAALRSAVDGQLGRLAYFRIVVAALACLLGAALTGFVLLLALAPEATAWLPFLAIVVAALAALIATFAVSIRGSAAHLDEARKALEVAGRLLGDLA